jgi:hypothetical protein
LKLYIPNNRNATIRFFLDSWTALEYATKTGETESYTLQILALQFQETTNACNLAVLYHCIQGIERTSRQVRSAAERSLYTNGSSQKDCFAKHESKR